jgi:hypothetical protein
VCKGELEGPFSLDGRQVAVITAYLFHAGGHEDPARLKVNEGKSFIGSYVLGMGFTFDDTDKKGIASPLAEMNRLIVEDPRNEERIFPYIGGEEVNDSPTHAYHRYVINFGNMPEHEAQQWPNLMTIVERKVRGTRASHSTAPWWQFERLRGELYAAIRGLDQMIVLSRVGNACAFALIDAVVVPSERLVVFAYQSRAAFCMLQSRLHEIWARFFGSTLKDDLMYAPEDCFQTFAFPPEFETNSVLEANGRAYYERRSQIMQKYQKGLTALYNEFHNPDSCWPEIGELRELHDAMDRAALVAYGWQDIQPVCAFYSEFDDGEEEGDGGRPRRKKYRYRWPDDIRDDVLARLLELNSQRAEEQSLEGAALETQKPKKREPTLYSQEDVS